MLKAIKDFILKDKLHDEILKFKQDIANFDFSDLFKIWIGKSYGSFKKKQLITFLKKMF